MPISTERIRWKSGYRASIDAATAWQVYEKVHAKTDGKPSAEDLVREAKSKHCPIHDAFEWSDAVAGHEYRLMQARLMMRSFVLVPEVASKATEGYRVLEIKVTPATEDEQRKAAYVPVADVMKDPVARTELLNRALSELLGIRRRYKHLQELGAVFAEVDAIQSSISVE